MRKRESSIQLHWLLFVLLILGIPQPAEALDCWEKVYLQRDEFASLSAGKSLAIMLRVYEDCPKERQVLLISESSSVISATILEPVGASVSQQIDSLRLKYKDKETSELCGLLQMKSRSVSSEEIPELKPLVDKLIEIRMSPAFQPEIIIHGVVYSIWISRLTNSSFFEFHGPPFRRSARSGALHPLDTWAQEVLGVLGLACRPENF
jgi:hypothetical protein